MRTDLCDLPQFHEFGELRNTVNDYDEPDISTTKELDAAFATLHQQLPHIDTLNDLPALVEDIEMFSNAVRSAEERTKEQPKTPPKISDDNEDREEFADERTEIIEQLLIARTQFLDAVGPTATHPVAPGLFSQWVATAMHDPKAAISFIGITDALTQFTTPDEKVALDIENLSITVKECRAVAQLIEDLKEHIDERSAPDSLDEDYPKWAKANTKQLDKLWSAADVLPT